MTPELETARLVLVPVSLEDAGFVQAEFPHWEIVRFMNGRVPWPYPADGAVTFLRDVLLAQIAQGEAHGWTMRLRDGVGTPVGLINLRIGDGENRGFWVARAFQGQGYAGEAADAVTDFYFRVLDQACLTVSKAVDNRASGRVSARQGMRLVGQDERDFVAGRLKVAIWSITREEWVRGSALRRGRNL